MKREPFLPAVTKDFPGMLLAQDLDGDPNVVRQVFSVAGVIDTYGDRIKFGAYKKTLKERMDRVKVLWMHDPWSPPIGVPMKLEEVPASELPESLTKRFPEATGALVGDIMYLDTPRAQEVLTGIKAGAITENSVGIDLIQTAMTDEQIPGKKETFKVLEIMEARLWDVSPVTWGANPATMNIKGAVPFKATGLDKASSWSKPSLSDFTSEEWENLEEGEKDRIAAHFGWVSGMPPETFGDCKLPHHNPAKSGVGSANWSGVKAAMSRLMQASTDVTDREEVYSHLAKHYSEFDEEPPDFKFIETAYMVRSLVEGGVDLYGCSEAMRELDAQLRKVGPRGDAATPTLDSAMEHIRLLRHFAEL